MSLKTLGITHVYEITSITPPLITAATILPPDLRLVTMEMQPAGPRWLPHYQMRL